MKSMEQMRAASAIKYSKLDRADVNFLPGLILGSGLLPTLAFCLASESRGGAKEALDAAAQHLATCGLVPEQARDAQGLVRHLAGEKAGLIELRRCTDEVLAFLGYLKRFTTKKGGA